jgi:triacylglycerol lipase
MKPSRTWQALIKPGLANDHFQTERPLPPFVLTEEYSPINALYMAELSRLVYADSVEQRRVGLKRVGMRELAFYDHNGTQAMLVYSKVWDVAFLVFRGSSEVKDWITNLTLESIAWPGGGTIHKGFKNALERVWNQANDALERLGCEVYAVGHSLGGTLAVQAALLFPMKATFTYGCPPIGNKFFARLFDGMPVYRHVHGPDKVPQMLRLMEHIGELHTLKEITFPWHWRNFWEPPRELRAHTPVNISVALERLL